MSTRLELLSAFADHPQATLSGAGLARQLGVTRTSIWKAAGELRKEGFPIESVNRQGYRLDASFDLSLFQLGGVSSVAKGYRVHYKSVVTSTQQLAKQAAAQSAPEGSVWVAERQTLGRGRLDRVWDSPSGGLWFSLLLRPTLPASRVPPLTLVAALSLREAIRKVTQVESKLKWPNDVLVEAAPGSWKKLAGILTEMAGDMDRTQWVVTGIGINVNNTLPEALKNTAVSIYELTRNRTARAALLKAFLIQFSEDYRLFQRSGFDAFQKTYWEACSRPNEEIVLRTSQGDIRGRTRGVDVFGAIIIESRRKRKHFSEGEIVL